MKKEIRSMMKTRKMGILPYIYRDLDSLDEIKDIKVDGVHAYCFCRALELLKELK